MEPIKIYPTRTTPAVLLDPNRGVFKMYGRSSPENSVQFYDPIRVNLTKIPGEKVDVRIKLEYFNTSSSKCIYDLLKEIKALRDKGKDVIVRWYYDEDDEDMLEAGEDYSDLLDLPFKFIEYHPKDEYQKTA
ncbi:protein of unknown function [Ekhidna lutea]|uniref:SiaC family regulatory phosphoprotein domain-containing protein n=1 Tax=Ekhidna lutea TaxID=447679 RepID=A0A239H019_EKHLU|nr:DUF1987 domain-containing protein [Ekhidna lutea]SNS74816.1 protein of unknown function [Ekhidna lutea]